MMQTIEIPVSEITIVPQRLIEARMSAGLSQAEAARRIGETRQHLWNWENGIAVPMGDNIAKLCKIYDTPIEFLTNEK